MTLDEFLTRRSPDWQALSAAVAGARGRVGRLGIDGALSLASLYRSASADLAYARRRFPGDPVVARLEGLVTSARAALYARPAGRSGRVRAFVFGGYWAQVAALRWELLFGCVFLFGAMAAGLLWSIHDPGGALGLMPAGLRPDVSHHFDPGDISAVASGGLASAIFTNNIRATALAFAGGIFLGIGTAALLIYNGLLIGIVAGVLSNSHQTERFFVYILPHGVLELSCILVSGAAGSADGDGDRLARPRDAGSGAPRDGAQRRRGRARARRRSWSSPASPKASSPPRASASSRPSSSASASAPPTGPSSSPSAAEHCDPVSGV